LIANTISEENVRTRKEFEKLRPLLDFIAKANSDDLRTYIGAWLETEECRAATAKEHGKPDKRIIKLALTDDQVAQFGKFSDDMSIELAKVLQRAHDFLYTCQTSSSISILTIPYHLHGQFMKTMDDRVDTWCRKTDHSDTKKRDCAGEIANNLDTTSNRCNFFS
jgi:hypothetical protein